MDAMRCSVDARQRNLSRAAGLALVVVAGACAADLPPIDGSTSGDAPQATDAAQEDTTGANDAPRGETGASDAVAGDGRSLDAASRCQTNSSWSCKPGSGSTLCTATCGGNTVTCFNSGDCGCGVIGFEPCGKYSGNICEVCRKAALDGCCRSKKP